MALSGVKPDCNVPQIGPRSRYTAIGLDSRWIVQHMKNAAPFDKKMPAQDTVAVEDLDPIIVAGKAEYNDLCNGGLFGDISKSLRAHIVEAIENPDTATLDIVRREDLLAVAPAIETAVSHRAVPTVFPFRLAPGETIRATGGTNSPMVRILIREAGEAIK